MLKIFADKPKDWNDLQIKVSQIWSGIGLNTEIEKDIQTVRGKVNVDVLAVDQKHLPHSKYIAECKNWEHAVPKHVVHSVRTIVHDFGANSGYIVSKVGFQSGAIEAAGNTNVYLLDFNEFQEIFRTRYIDNMVDELESVAYPLRMYCDPTKSFLEEAFENLSEEKKKEYYRLGRSAYIAWAGRAMNYKDLRTGKLDDPDFMIEKLASEYSHTIKGDCLFNYFNSLKDYCESNLAKFDALFGKRLRKWE